MTEAEVDKVLAELDENLARVGMQTIPARVLEWLRNRLLGIDKPIEDYHEYNC